MKIEGVWKVEMLGPYGWENVATAFLKDGVYHDASKDHFSIGTYSIANDVFRGRAIATVHGEARAIFGKKQSRIEIAFEGKLASDVIDSRVSDTTGVHSLHCRMKKLAGF